MELSHNLKKILLVGMSALMLASVGAGTDNLTANARRRYRPRITRRYRVRNYRRAMRRYRKRPVRRYHKKVTRKPKQVNSKRTKESKRARIARALKDYYEMGAISDSSKYNAQQSKDAIKQINGYRAERGLKPYYEDKELDNIAMLRAKNIARDKEEASHYDNKNHEWYADEDAYKLGYIKNPKEDDFDENIADGYNNAHDANNDLMYHDADSDWGHRDNILGKIQGEGANYTGAGYYDGYLVEEFTYSNDLEYNYDH